MASTLNAFDLLKGAESTLQQKKKKKSKPKKALDAVPVVESVAEPSSDEQIVEQVQSRSFSPISGWFVPLLPSLLTGKPRSKC